MTERIDVGIQNQGLEENFPFGITYRAIAVLKSREANAIFANIFNSSEFLDTFGWLKGLLSFDNKGGFTSHHRSALAAHLFEQFAYFLVKSRIREIPIADNTDSNVGLKVLSQTETIELLNIAYPYSPEILTHMGLSQSKGRIKNPDGVVVGLQGGNTVLVGFCEYTLQYDSPGDLPRRKFRQIKKLESGDLIRESLANDESQWAVGEFIHSIRPDLPPRLVGKLKDCILIFVRPKKVDDIDDVDQRIIGNRVHVYTPFIREQFYLVIDSLIADTLAKVAEQPVSAD